MTTKLTAEEIGRLKSIQEKSIQLVEKFGITEIKIQEFTLQKEFLKEELKQLRAEENEIGESLQKLYGNGTIDLEKGEFTSA